MNERAMQLMRDAVEAARKLAAKGELSRYMLGYYSGRIDVLAFLVGSDEAFKLRDEMDTELNALPRRES